MSAQLNSAKPDFTAAMARLREIATTSADNALTEGPVNADRHLLDLCAETLHALIHAERSRREGREVFQRDLHDKTAENLRPVWQALHADATLGTKSAKPLLGRIRKIKARTAAGIYAKAAVVRASKTGAADLAMSLAQDLLECPGLRASLWPAGEVSLPGGGN
jgi:hypothetical protein